MISVAITTYNHEHYISQAIDSVLCQKCDTSIEIVISDDCSTDGTSDICIQYAKKYPDKVVYIRNTTNVGLLENYRQLFNRCSGDYIAWLDGDDYWCDDEKLQKQMKVLESGSYKMCCSDKYVEKNRIIYISPFWTLDTLSDLLSKGNSICTPTVLCSRNLIDRYIDGVVYVAKQRKWKTVDFGIWANVLHDMPKSIYFMNDYTAVYRIVDGSGSHGNSKEKAYQWDACVCDMMHYYYHLYEQRSMDVVSYIFHLRKRMILDYRWMAREQIWPLLKLITYYPMIFYRSIVRKMKKS